MESVFINMPKKVYFLQEKRSYIFPSATIVLTLAIMCIRIFFTQEITPVEIGRTVANLLIVASITALTPIIYNSVSSDLIATH